MSGRHPPRLAGWLVRRVLSVDDANRLLDALGEEYCEHQAPGRGRLAADIWYWWQVLRSIPPLVRSAAHGLCDGLAGRVAPGASDRTRVFGGMAAMRTDVRHLRRVLVRARFSSAAAILTLAITLGAGTSIFAVVDAVILRPPPFADPDALVTLGEVPVDRPTDTPRAVGWGRFMDWRDRAGAMAELAAWDPTNLTVTGGGGAERVSATNVTPGFLTVLGVRPAMGRLPAADDVGAAVVVISSAFWRGRLASDPSVVGSELVLDGLSHVIIGVLPERFFFALNSSDVWRPLPVAAGEPADGFGVRVIARLGAGVGASRLTAALNDVSRLSSPPARSEARPIASVISDGSRPTLAVLGGAAALSIVIAFANLAVLLMVRSMDRRRELAVREAMGAPPTETARQLLLEAVALVVAGNAAGVLLAMALTPVVGRFALEFGGLAQRDTGVSWRAAGAVCVIAVALAAVCAILPAVHSRRHRIVDVLRRAAAFTSEEISLRRFFVAGEVALAFALLVSMALLAGSLRRMLAVDAGFEPDGLVALQVSVPADEYGRDRVVAFYTSLRTALAARLGAGSVAIVSEVPLTGDGGRDRVRAGTVPGIEAVVRSASADYFNVMRIPLVAGRGFRAEDNDQAPARTVITESLARLLFRGEEAAGRTILLGRTEQSVEVIGVAGDVRHRALDEAPLATVYLPAEQAPSASSILVVRSDRRDAAVVTAVREEVARLDRNVPVYGIRSMRDVVAASPGVPARRLLRAAMTAFALLALLLSTIGLFGVAAHDVARRRSELALRAALGATPLRIVRATLVDSASIVAAGLAAGMLLSVGLVRVLGSTLFAPVAPDLLLTGGVATGILVLTGMAAILPIALRAARSDPLRALRSD